MPMTLRVSPRRSHCLPTPVRLVSPSRITSPGPGIEQIEAATDRVAAAADAARLHGLVLTARAENHLYGITDLDDTIVRLGAYRDAGADVVYAPLIAHSDEVTRVVALGAPVNVLALRPGPSVRELAALGVRRVSTGGALAFAAYGAAASAARELLEHGTSAYSADTLSPEDRNAAFS